MQNKKSKKQMLIPHLLMLLMLTLMLLMLTMAKKLTVLTLMLLLMRERKGENDDVCQPASAVAAVGQLESGMGCRQAN